MLFSNFTKQALLEVTVYMFSVRKVLESRPYYQDILAAALRASHTIKYIF